MFDDGRLTSPSPTRGAGKVLGGVGVSWTWAETILPPNHVTMDTLDATR